MGQFQCITPKHLVLRQKVRDHLLRHQRDMLTNHELRQVVLSNFTITTAANGTHTINFP